MKASLFSNNSGERAVLPSSSILIGLDLNPMKVCNNRYAMTEAQKVATDILKDPIFIEIVSQLRPHAGKDVEIKPESIILSDLGMDSLAIMDFVFDLEDALDLSIPEHRIAEVKTISDLVKAVYKLQQEA
jgi:acyl carrier protein